MKNYAYIDFVNTYYDISIKNRFISKIYPKYEEWYIKRKNPLIVTEENFFSVKKLNINIPITKNIAEINKKIYNEIMKKTINNLLSMDVQAMIVPKGYEIDTKEIYILKGIKIFPYFLKDVVKKALEIKNKELKYAEILIIASHIDLTDTIIEILYNHVNYLSILTKEKSYYGGSISERIYAETGLRIQVTNNKNAISRADIVINTNNYKSYNYIFKKDSIYIELSENLDLIKKLEGTRKDVLAINRCILEADKKEVTLKEVEALLYLNSRDYRVTAHRGHNISRVNKILGFIDKQKLKVYKIK